MPAGMVVYNDSGVIQITDAQRNFVLLAQQTVTGVPDDTGFSSSMGPMYKFTYPNTLGYPPICAVHCAGDQLGLVTVRLISGNWTYYCRGPRLNAAGQSATAYFFGPQPNSAPLNYGLQIFRSDGTLAYDGAYKPMRVKANITAGGTYNWGDGRKYAFVLGDPAYDYWIIPAGTWTVVGHYTMYQSFAGGVTITGGVEYFRQMWGFYPPSGERHNSTLQGLIIDVTGY